MTVLDYEASCSKEFWARLEFGFILVVLFVTSVHWVFGG